MFHLALSLAPFGCMTVSRTNHVAWSMVVLVAVSIAVSLAPFACMAVSRTVHVAMIYGSFGGCFNWQFLWHHLHAWQFPEQIMLHDLWLFWWLFQLAVSLAPFACMAVSRTVHVAMISGSFGGCFNWQFLWHHLHAWQFPEQFMWHDLWQFWWLFQLAVSLAPFACMAVSRIVPVAMIYGSFGGYFNWQFLWHHLHAWQFLE